MVKKILREENKEKEHYGMRMVTFIKATTRITYERAKASSDGPMDQFMKVNSPIMLQMATELKGGQMEMSM